MYFNREYYNPIHFLFLNLFHLIETHAKQTTVVLHDGACVFNIMCEGDISVSYDVLFDHASRVF